MEKINLINEMSIQKKTIITFTGALLFGVIWRIRGNGGFGSFWGMLVVGTIYCLFLNVLFGESKKITWGLFGVMVVSMAITVGGWGTIVGQVTGRVYSFGHGNSAAYSSQVNPVMGWVWMFFIGFGWFPLFAFLTAQIFSEKDYSFKDYLIIVAVFYAALYFSELVLSHLIIPVLSPDAYALYANSLSEITPWRDYVLNFKDASYYDSIVGGRNYGAMVSNFSSSFGALNVGIWLKFNHKDGIATRLYFGMILILGISIAVADIWQFWGRGCLYDFSTQSGTCEPPEWLKGEHWPLWEFSTGFLAGLGITYLLINTKQPDRNIQLLSTESDNKKDKIIDDNNENGKNNDNIKKLIPERNEKFFTAFISILFVLGYSIIRPFASRMDPLFPDMNFTLLINVIGGVIIFILAFWFYKSKKDTELQVPNRILMIKHSSLLLVIYIAIYTSIAIFLIEEIIVFESINIMLVLFGCIASIPLVLLISKWKINSNVIHKD